METAIKLAQTAWLNGVVFHPKHHAHSGQPAIKTSGFKFHLQQSAEKLDEITPAASCALSRVATRDRSDRACTFASYFPQLVAERPGQTNT
jgi:hypothetical protein